MSNCKLCKSIKNCKIYLSKRFLNYLGIYLATYWSWTKMIACKNSIFQPIWAKLSSSKNWNQEFGIRENMSWNDNTIQLKKSNINHVIWHFAFFNYRWTQFGSNWLKHRIRNWNRILASNHFCPWSICS